jgi:LacI family transcriptional regulator
MPATLRDVARHAGVSVTTAHRGINGKGELNEETRQRILHAVRELGYVRNETARSLVSGRSNTIGMIVTDNASPVYAGIVRGVESVVKAAGYGLLLCNSADDPIEALSCLELLRSKQVDGVLITPVQSDLAELDYLRDAQIPYVLLLRTFGDVLDDVVVTDNESGGRAATGLLVELGHRRIGHIAGPAHISSARGRLAGYTQALQDGSVAFDPDLVVHAPYTTEGGYVAALDLLNRDDRPSAIFSANDMQAVGVMKAARELGVRIPDELALVGGDNIELAEFLEIPLTTFHQPAFEIGSRGAEVLLSRLVGDTKEHQQIVMTPQLIVRQSSGGPR